MGLPQPPNSAQHPRRERLDRFTVGRGEPIRVFPEATEPFGIGFHQLRGADAFPVTEMQLLQVGVQGHGQ
jgi:hypothetical protein